MTEFVGRTGSRRVYSYPETPRGASAAFARNSAAGPQFDGPLPITQAGVPIPWAAIESVGTVPPGTTDVPITPRVTGVVRVICTIEVENVGTTQNVEAVLELAGSPVASFANTILGPGEGPDEFETITFAFDFNPSGPGGSLPVGTTSQLSVKLLSDVDDVSLQLNAATFDVQELQTATG